MQIIKFDIDSPPDFVIQDVLSDIGGVITYGYYIQAPSGDMRINDNDFIMRSEGNIYVYSLVQINSDIELRETFREYYGGQVLKELFSQMDSISPFTPAQEADLINRTLAVLVLLENGNLQRARRVCNGLTIGGELTAPRKNFLLARIDNAISILS